MPPFIETLLDLVMIVLLAATVFYAARLSGHLKVFRESRRDFDKLVGDLSAQIQRAEGAITGLRDAAKTTGINDAVAEARSIADELQLMISAGDKLASRIEKLADKTSTAGAAPAALPKETAAVEPIRRKEKSSSKFSIRDPEFDGGAGGGDDYEVPADLQTEAERELFKAMSKRRKEDAGKAR